MHLFEFMDEDWVPRSLRATLRDILECGNSQPFRPYYDWVAKEVLAAAARNNCEAVMEMGAGTAPITRHLLKIADSQQLRLYVSDLNPDLDAYQELDEVSGGQVECERRQVDFSQPWPWPPNSLLVLSATFHHVPEELRCNSLEALAAGGRPVAIFEPLNKNLASYLFTFLSLVPALLTPLRFLNRPGRLRRILWCWLVPVAPVMFVWDGIASCARQWSTRQWKEFLTSSAHTPLDAQMQQSLFTRMVEFQQQRAAVEDRGPLIARTEHACGSGAQ